jgi:hypothetical protein
VIRVLVLSLLVALLGQSGWPVEPGEVSAAEVQTGHTQGATCGQGHGVLGASVIALASGTLGTPALAQQGCCSHHDGVCGYQNGRASCCDGALSPSCGCD